MMLFKLSLKNIKKSFKDYLIYFVTLIIGVAIFYVFNAIDAQTVMMNVTSSKKDIIKLMTSSLSVISVFVSFVLGFLIIYASRFLIKRRNKEFALYLTMGMSKRKISMILFFETLFIGLISLVVGLFLGISLSQLMSVVVANSFDANLTKFVFIVSKEAIIKTLIYFSIMYLLVMIFNTISITKCKLIDLLQASKKGEKIKIKNTFLCLLILFIGIGMLVVAYYLVTDGIGHLKREEDIIKPIILGILGTFLVLSQITTIILKILKKCKRYYYKDLNCFTLRQLESKINTTVFSTTIICLMLFVTICTLASALSLKNSMEANMEKLSPVDVVLTLKNNDEITLPDGIKDLIKYRVYYDDNFTLKNSLSTVIDTHEEKNQITSINDKEDIMSISDYNKVAKLFNNETFTLKNNEYLVVADFKNMVTLRNQALKNKTKITINNKTYYPKYDECRDGFISISSNHINTGIIILPDKDVDNLNYETLYAFNYNSSKKEEKQKQEDLLINYLVNANIDYEIETKLTITENSIGLGAIVTFISIYLGLVFLLSSSALLALKELSESSDNAIRYQMLRKLGADEGIINKALFKQILSFFILPLIFAIIHSYFGLKFANFILEVIGNEKLLSSIITTAIFIILIYGGYFFLTYFYSKNIIRENSR